MSTSKKEKIILPVAAAENKSEKINFLVTPTIKRKLDAVREKHGFKDRSKTITGILEWFFEQDGIK